MATHLQDFIEILHLSREFFKQLIYIYEEPLSPRTINSVIMDG